VVEKKETRMQIGQRIRLKEGEGLLFDKLLSSTTYTLTKVSTDFGHTSMHFEAEGKEQGLWIPGWVIDSHDFKTKVELLDSGLKGD
jgi:hypothetical protein